MSKAKIIESEVKSVPFSSIYVDDQENIRSDISKEKIDAMVKQIEEHGLIEPLVVVNGGKEGQEYRLLAGFRRYAALKQLKHKTVNVVVRSVWDPLVMFAENVRENPNAIDKSARMWELHEGQYAAPPGVEQRKHSISELAKADSTSESSVRTYLRIHERLCTKARNLAKTHSEVPLRVLHQMALEGGKNVDYFDVDGELLLKLPNDFEGKPTKTKVWEPDEDKQLRIFHQWLTRFKAAADAGQTRSSRGEGGDGAAVEKDSYDLPKEKVKGGKAGLAVRAAIKVLLSKKDEDEFAQARAEGLRFALGDLTRLPGVSKEELKEMMAALKAKDAEGEE